MFQTVLFCRVIIIFVSEDCYFKMDLVQFQIAAVCDNPEEHKTRMTIVSLAKKNYTQNCVQNTYSSHFIHILIPWVSVFLNIIVFFCIRRRKIKSKLPKKGSERALVINSLVVSLILTVNYLYNYCYTLLKPVSRKEHSRAFWKFQMISHQSDAIQSAFSFFNLYGCSCFNFIVYFLLDSTTRKRVLSMFYKKERIGVSANFTTTFW